MNTFKCLFKIGKYIVITTLFRLGKDEHRIVISQHVYTIDGTCVDNSSTTLGESDESSDFFEFMFIGVQRSVTRIYSNYNIGYLEYCSGDISTQNRATIVSKLAASWR